MSCILGIRLFTIKIDNFSLYYDIIMAFYQKIRLCSNGKYFYCTVKLSFIS